MRRRWVLHKHSHRGPNSRRSPLPQPPPSLEMQGKWTTFSFFTLFSLYTKCTSKCIFKEREGKGNQVCCEQKTCCWLCCILSLNYIKKAHFSLSFRNRKEKLHLAGGYFFMTSKAFKNTKGHSGLVGWPIFRKFLKIFPRFYFLISKWY